MSQACSAPRCFLQPLLNSAALNLTQKPDRTMTLRPFVYLLALLLGSTLVGCDIVGLGDDDEPDLIKGMAAAETGDNEVPFVATHRDGEYMVLLSEPDSDRITGVTYSIVDGESLTLHLDEDGLPRKATDGEYIYLMENYRESVVDVVRIDPDGSIEVERDAELDTEFYNFAETFSDKAEARVLSDISLGQGIALGGIALGTFGCVKATIWTLGAAGVPCGKALASATTAVAAGMAADEVAKTSSWIGYQLGIPGCVMGDPEACLGTLVQFSGDIVKIAEDRFDEREEEIAQATSALRFAGVWDYRTIDDGFFVIEDDRAYDAITQPGDTCYSINIVDFVSVDGNVFTWEYPDSGATLEAELELVSEDVLTATRLADGATFTWDRAVDQDTDRFFNNACDNLLPAARTDASLSTLTSEIGQ